MREKSEYSFHLTLTFSTQYPVTNFPVLKQLNVPLTTEERLPTEEMKNESLPVINYKLF